MGGAKRNTSTSWASMGKPKRGRRSLPNGRSAGSDAGARFIVLYHGLIRSPAFKYLPGDAVKLLLGIWTFHNGQNNGDIAFSVRDAAKFGIGKDAASQALGWLEELRFIECTEPAAMLGRRSRRWRLTEESVGGVKPARDCRQLSDAAAAAIVEQLGAKKRKRLERVLPFQNRSRPGRPDEYVLDAQTQSEAASPGIPVASETARRKRSELTLVMSGTPRQS
jgi:hypothetical protein